MIHVYTGNGKGKTTAAIGLVIRAAGAGKKIYMGQFIKGKPYSELRCLKKIKNITIEQYGRGCFIKRKPSRIDIDLAQKGLARARAVIESGTYDLVVLDEVNCALAVKLLSLRDVMNAVKRAPRTIELILTGRNAPRSLINIADLVSEIREIKHYYRKGLQARRGIEF